MGREVSKEMIDQMAVTLLTPKTQSPQNNGGKNGGKEITANTGAFAKVLTESTVKKQSLHGQSMVDEEGVLIAEEIQELLAEIKDLLDFLHIPQYLQEKWEALSEESQLEEMIMAVDELILVLEGSPLIDMPQNISHEQENSNENKSQVVLALLATKIKDLLTKNNHQDKKSTTIQRLQQTIENEFFLRTNGPTDVEDNLENQTTTILHSRKDVKSSNISQEQVEMPTKSAENSTATANGKTGITANEQHISKINMDSGSVFPNKVEQEQEVKQANNNILWQQRESTTDSINQQMLKQVKIMLSEGKSEISFQLHPKELGKLTLNINVEKGIITAKFAATNYQVKSIIESSLPQLRQSLEELGMKESKLEVNVGQQFLGDGHKNQPSSTYYAKNLKKAVGNSESQLGENYQPKNMLREHSTFEYVV